MRLDMVYTITAPDFTRGTMLRCLCPFCHAALGAHRFERAADSQRCWLACPDCDGLIPLPSAVAVLADDPLPDCEAAIERTGPSDELQRT